MQQWWPPLSPIAAGGWFGRWFRLLKDRSGLAAVKSLRGLTPRSRDGSLNSPGSSPCFHIPCPSAESRSHCTTPGGPKDTAPQHGVENCSTATDSPGSGTAAAVGSASQNSLWDLQVRTTRFVRASDWLTFLESAGLNAMRRGRGAWRYCY